MNAAVGLTAGLGLDGDRCIRVIPRQNLRLKLIFFQISHLDVIFVSTTFYQIVKTQNKLTDICMSSNISFAKFQLKLSFFGGKMNVMAVFDFFENTQS